MKTTLARRLNKARNAAGLSQPELEAASGVSQASISKIERGDQVRSGHTPALAIALNCDTDWLAGAIGEDDKIMLRNAAAETSPPYNVESAFEGDNASYPIDYLDIEGSCGAGSTIYDNGEAEAVFKKGVIRKEASWFVRYSVQPTDVFAVYAKGDSNAEFICDGDMVIFNRRKKTPISGKLYLIQHPDGLKIKVLRQTLSGWVIESKNRDYPDETVSNDILERLEVLGEYVYRQGA